MRNFWSPKCFYDIKDSTTRSRYKKTCYVPIDYESIDHVDCWVIEEETPPNLDIDEFKNALYHESAIPFGESSINHEGECLLA
ncbi:hypothetical protein JHK86_025314 [Glycine max]|nr:hypothetical protein JHK86_025314 [Glycine max]